MFVFIILFVTREVKKKKFLYPIQKVKNINFVIYFAQDQ